VTKVLEWSRKHDTLHIVDDQISTPTWARTLAEATAQVIAQGKSVAVDYICEKSGLYHLTSAGLCSRYDWAKFILALDPEKGTQVTKELIRASSSDFSNPAKRPKLSVLCCNKFQTTFKVILPDWRDTLALAMAN